MKRKKQMFVLVPVYLSFLFIFILIGILGSKAITVLFQSRPPTYTHTYIIDAGHGGVDGGATSVSGVLESHINLSIAQKLNDVMRLLGMQTVMIRTEDISVYTEGNSIAAKKLSDLKQRVKLVNNTPGAVLLSIHQNHFTDSKYAGAQVFHATTPDSRELAEKMQKTFTNMTATDRNIKPVKGVYLMQEVACPAVLIECGFISNVQEEALLLSKDYQLKISGIIACSCSEYFNASIA